MRNKPFTLHVLNKPYQVEFLDSLGMKDNLGSTSRSTQRIQLLETLGTEQMEDTLLHEILHIISHELMLELDEATICRLAVGLHSAGYRR